MCCKLEYDKPSLELVYQAKSRSTLSPWRAVGLVERTTAVSAPTNPAERPSACSLWQCQSGLWRLKLARGGYSESAIWPLTN